MKGLSPKKPSKARMLNQNSSVKPLRLKRDKSKGSKDSSNSPYKKHLNDEAKLTEVLDETFVSQDKKNENSDEEMTKDKMKNKKAKDEAIFGSFNRGVA